MKIICSLLLAAVSFAPSASGAKTELQSLLEANRLFSADFELQVVDETKEVVHESEGQFTVKQPNHFYWVDNDSIIVADGTDLWFMDTLAEQVTVYSLEEQQSQSPLSLLTDSNSKLWQKYDVSKVKGEFLLMPKAQSDTRIKKFSLTFNQQRVLVGFWFEDDQQQKSTYMLSNVKQLKSVKESLFKLEVPKNMVIDDQRR